MAGIEERSIPRLIVIDVVENPWHSGVTMRKHAEVTGRYEPSTINTLNAFHVAYSPVQSKTAILYVSGTRQLTEFRVSDEGFCIIVWQAPIITGGESKVTSFRMCGMSSNPLWKTLEVDCLSGHARLSDRASVRGVGGNPCNRKYARATDDVATVCHWLTRSEQWLEKRIAGQRKAILRANKGLAEVNPGDSKIPFLPPSMQFELANNAAINHDVTANVLPSQLSVGSVKHWDSDGALAMRGKRVSSGSTTKTLAGKRDRIARLKQTALFQVGEAAKCEQAGDDMGVDEYVTMALETEARIASLQGELNARMAHARAARRAKRAAIQTVAVSPVAAEAIVDELTGARKAREAAAGQADPSEATDASDAE